METWRKQIVAPLCLLLGACVPSVLWPSAERAVVSVEDVERACEAVDPEHRGSDPLAGLRITHARPIIEIEGKNRVMRTTGVRILAEHDGSAREIESRARCRALQLAAAQAEALGCELLAVDGVQVEVRSRARRAVELRLTAPTRSAGVELARRAREHVEGTACGMGDCRALAQNEVSSCAPPRRGSS